MHYLACDLGAESGRLMLGSLEDNRLSLEELHRFPNVPIEDAVGRHWNVGLFADCRPASRSPANAAYPSPALAWMRGGLIIFCSMKPAR